MKAVINAILLFCILALYACPMPHRNVYFKNLSDQPVRLIGRLVDKSRFEKLPNKVDFYDTSKSKKEMHGERKYRQFVTWTDSTAFFIDVPANTVIDIADISRGLGLGKVPDVMLVTATTIKTDTILRDNPGSVYERFQYSKRFFSRGSYHYDYK